MSAFISFMALMTEGTTSFSNYGGFILIGVMLVVFYFFLIRPQKKQEKEANNMRNSLAVGDEITTIGGIIGQVVSIKDETFVLETTKDKTRIRLLRSAIRTIDVKVEDKSAAAEARKTEVSESASDTEAAVEGKKKFGKKGKKAEEPETVSAEPETKTEE